MRFIFHGSNFNQLVFLNDETKPYTVGDELDRLSSACIKVSGGGPASGLHADEPWSTSHPLGSTRPLLKFLQFG
jgi:hypothetical protein